MVNPESRTRPVHFDVYGDVQGVGFRWFVQHQAQSLGLRGWVRNCPDGSVEVAAAGAAAALLALERALWQGPPHAHVRDVRRSPYASAAPALPQPFAIAP